MSRAVLSSPHAVPAAAHHRREHRSLLAAAEKRLLIWIAGRLPRAITSDHLSLLGLVAMMAAGLAFAATPRGPLANAAVVVALALNWFGDSLDGTVARVRDQQRPRFGFYVDHVIDLVGATCLLGGLAYSGLMTPVLALAVLVAYLLLSAEIYLATHVSGVFRLSFAGWGPTELRIVLAIGAVAVTRYPWVSLLGIGPHRLFDVGGAVAVVGLFVTFVVSAAMQTRALYLAEPIPTVDRDRSVA